MPETRDNWPKPKKFKPRKRPRHAWVKHAIDLSADGFLRALTWLAGRLPYKQRVSFFGWASARLIGPVLGVPGAYKRELAWMFPDKSDAEVAATATAVSDNSGRSIIEMYAGDAFLDLARQLPLEGDGVDAILKARDAGQTAVFATAHFGNYNAARAALIANGFNLGALYKPATNERLDRHYSDALGAVGGTLYPRNRKGLAGIVRHLRSGQPIMFLFDLHVTKGALLRFFGRPTMTSLSAAELALRHNALLVPFYGIREPDGLGFRVVIDAPIAHSTPEAMTQALNDGLEARIRQRPDQWFYLHKRWKKIRKTKPSERTKPAD